LQCYHHYMASITIRRLDDSIKARLRVRAASRGRSMEQEAREILKAGLTSKSALSLNLADAIGSHYFPHGPNASRPEKLTGLA